MKTLDTEWDASFIREFLSLYNIKQVELINKYEKETTIKLSKTSMSLLVAGKRKPTNLQLSVIIKILNLSEDELKELSQRNPLVAAHLKKQELGFFSD